MKLPQELSDHLIIYYYNKLQFNATLLSLNEPNLTQPIPPKLPSTIQIATTRFNGFRDSNCYDSSKPTNRFSRSINLLSTFQRQVHRSPKNSSHLHSPLSAKEDQSAQALHNTEFHKCWMTFAPSCRCLFSSFSLSLAKRCKNI